MAYLRMYTWINVTCYQEKSDYPRETGNDINPTGTPSKQLCREDDGVALTFRRASCHATSRWRLRHRTRLVHEALRRYTRAETLVLV
ncbi:hypothetical protein TELCIR_06828 [Teladorsagia circumcincta]|uniref:Uncharacterized protein n=1 Tax=Teladorsagia circumcincta TaxID=45464 RepID=A0A2G9UM93_TELCI|nr:hypothetical protein TELCIR_06828 [Teladorsagia circumcincta]